MTLGTYRIGCLQDSNPGLEIYPVGDRAWQARWPDGRDYEIVVTRYTLRELLDRLEQVLAYKCRH